MQLVKIDLFASYEDILDEKSVLRVKAIRLLT